MLSFILKTLILLYLIIMIYSVLNLQKYNKNGITIEISDEKKFINELSYLNPLKFYISINHNSENLPVKYILDGNEINLYDSYSLNQFLFIHKRKEILPYDSNKYINKLMENKYLYPLNHSISIYKKNVIIPIERCIHNYNFIGIIDGETTIYLFNPKHKQDIINKQNNEIKKWGHKIVLKRGDCISIPTNWYYIQETNDKCIQYHIDIDTIFTFIPLFFK